eukprot:CAMPEP_0113303082 /NCGR_PEP_ID=MMETSP0010_2-20120614/3644_1 /TAXON_ID=216773 ORGANISM="Corethron hystrix, Strain 308" /NCGR_SAMPLE_ID=MMETSP0010_2 /ASSEMBLY_ACC=CAM_ASM_000155 /LENGTH=111 /DNA_ID=CAMNT_0000157015 /DNA_START=194 /DNA_END=526 /DNA_ORIENTATION=- /assembly_acc=CAM_ASM_000155
MRRDPATSENLALVDPAPWSNHRSRSKTSASTSFQSGRVRSTGRKWEKVTSPRSDRSSSVLRAAEASVPSVSSRAFTISGDGILRGVRYFSGQTQRTKSTQGHVSKLSVRS